MKLLAVMVNPLKPEAAQVAQEVRGRLAQAGLGVTENMDKCDALIAVGGDGTILHALRMAMPYGKPILGINAGRLGFLAGLERQELDLLPRLATGEFTLDRRMLLEARVWQGERFVTGGLCLNDAVLSRQRVSHAVEVRVRCGDNGCLSYLGDGVIFATPTGSTAYNFSAGGPIVEPAIESILLTPVCNHKMLTRTLLFSAQTQFSAEVTEEGLALALDAQPPVALLPGQRVTVRTSASQAQLIRLKPDGFLDVLNKKMGSS